MPPDLPRDARSVADLMSFYSQSVAENKARAVDVKIVSLDGIKSIRTIIRVPQEPTGVTYVGALTVPSVNGSFVFKVQALEHGMTGVKEANITNRLLTEGVTVAAILADPTRFDQECYDAEFPKHPLAHVRRTLGYLETSIQFADKIKDLTGFPLP